jgi:lysozyme family protein
MAITTTIDVGKLLDGVVTREGGYTDHAADLGGPTIWGVTQQVARAFGYKGDMRTMPRTTALDIYRLRYWRAPHLDMIADRYPDVAAELFDIGVNMGVGIAGTFLQRCLNVFNQQGTQYADIPTDGGIGALTLHALDCFRQQRGQEGGERLLEAIRDLRGARYIEISESRPANEAFTYGWVGRMVDMLKARFR